MEREAVAMPEVYGAAKAIFAMPASKLTRTISMMMSMPNLRMNCDMAGLRSDGCLRPYARKISRP